MSKTVLPGWQKTTNTTSLLSYKKHRIKLMLIWVFVGISTLSYTQKVAKLSLSGRISNTLDLGSVDMAGDHKMLILDTEQWLDYACKLDKVGTTVNITAHISSGTIPAGIEIYLEASDTYADGWGQPGVTTGKVQLSNIPVVIVSDIGNCWTGNSKIKGRQLTYYFQVTNYVLLETSLNPLSVLFTLF